MQRSDKTMGCLTAGLVLATSVRVAIAQGNPYQGIVERNIFALKPPPPPPDPDTIKPPPPPISLQGITSMFGRRQVMFKAMMSGSQPNEPAKEIAMVLGVNERLGNIEVVSIDEKGGAIEFNNHGTMQTLRLTNTVSTASPGMVVATFPAIGAPPTAASALNPGGAAAQNPAPTDASTAFGGSAQLGAPDVPADVAMRLRREHMSQANNTAQREYERREYERREHLKKLAEPSRVPR